MVMSFIEEVEHFILALEGRFPFGLESLLVEVIELLLVEFHRHSCYFGKIELSIRLVTLATICPLERSLRV